MKHTTCLLHLLQKSFVTCWALLIATPQINTTNYKGLYSLLEHDTSISTLHTTSTLVLPHVMKLATKPVKLEVFFHNILKSCGMHFNLVLVVSGWRSLKFTSSATTRKYKVECRIHDTHLAEGVRSNRFILLQLG